LKISGILLPAERSREAFMTKNNVQILILEDDAYFRGILESVCNTMGSAVAVSDVHSASSFLTKQIFHLLLLDWHLNQADLSTLFSTIDNFQPKAQRIALFTVPDLNNVITAMKSGASDILWAALDRESLKMKIQDTLSQSHKPVRSNSLSRLADSITEKAMDQKTSLFQARREFSRTFLQQILCQQKLRRTQLADLMDVSPRTLHRHLSA
jgi:DNA-binding NtrC family response regulator